MIITSTANPRVKELRRLRERKARQETGRFFIEGLRIVAEAVQQSAPVETLVIAPDLLTSAFGWEMAAAARDAGAEWLEVGVEVFHALSNKEGPQGIAAVVRQRWTALDDVRLDEGRTWVALDSPQDPGNVGAILRTHDAVGGAGVILLDQATDPYDSASARASMGALFSQRLVRASLAEFAAWKRRTGAPVVGTSDKAAQDYHTAHYPWPLVLLMGSERAGLTPAHLELCDQVVAIPMLGRSDSLNLAVATGVVLYEIYNHHRDGG